MSCKAMRAWLLLFLFCGAAAAQGVMTTYVGTDWIFSGDGAPARNAPLGVLSGVTIAPDGNPVLVDTSNCIVAKILPNGTLSVLAGNGFCGRSRSPSFLAGDRGPDFLDGDGGPATRAALYNPVSAAYDPQGNLYVSSLSQVRRINPQGFIDTIAGSPDGTPGFAGDGGLAVQAKIASFGGLASDAQGNIYLTDGGNNRIRKIALDGTISTIAGTGVAGFSGDGGPATKATLGNPAGLVFDASGNLCFADVDNARIRKITPGGTISTIASNVSVWSLAMDSSGTFYFGGSSFAGPNGVYKLAPGAAAPVAIAGNGVPGFSGDGGPAAKARVRGTPWVAVDGAGNVYFADTQNYRLRRIGNDGNINTVAGNGNYRYAGEGTPPLDTPINAPLGLAVDAGGNVYYSDELGYRVRKAARGADGVVRVTTVAGNGTPLADYEASDVGPAIQISLTRPAGLAIDGGGNLYIAESGQNRVRVVNPQGTAGTLVQVPGPAGLVLDRAGNLYVASADSCRVLKVDTGGRNSTVVAGSDKCGYSGDGGPATAAQLNLPLGLAMDGAGNLYIADRDAHVVRKVTPDGKISTFAGNGFSGSSGDGGLATKASLASPNGVAIDSAGNVYISEFLGGRIRKVDASGVISTFAGAGQSDDPGDGKVASLATLTKSTDIAFDGAGNLYIADQGFNRVRVVLAAPPAIQVSPATLNLPSAPSGGAPVTQPLAVTGCISGLQFNVSIKSSGPGIWLSADTTADQTPRLVALTADPANLPPGAYSASVTITPVSATPAWLAVNVSFTVSAALNPKLAVDQAELSFSLSRGGAARSLALKISNAGGQTLSYAASASTASGGSWLSVSPAGGQATPGKPSSVSVAANPTGLPPGTYTGAISIASTGGNATVPVIMTLSDNPQTVILSQTGLSFTAVAQGGVIPPQSFGVINAGSGVMTWQARTSTTAGGNWLAVSPATGSSDAAGVSPQVTVTVDAARLAAGLYYGIVRIDAPATANQVRVLTVFLDVLPAGTPVAASVQPPELVFHADTQGVPPGSLNLSVYNIGATPRSFTSTRSSGSFSLLTLPGNGSLDPNQPTRVLLQPNSSFPAGTSTGALTFQFSDGSVQVVKVTVIATDHGGAQSPQTPAKTSRAPSPGAACTPSQLVVSLKTLSQAFQVSAGWPVGLSVNAADDCSNPLVAGAGSVWAHFDNGEDDVPLTALGDGTWQGTWRPQNVNPNVTVTINARSGTLPIAQKVVSGAQSSANDRPSFKLSSIASVFATPTPVIRPLAPGSFLSIFGERLSDFIADAGGALPQTLANTQVYFNDLPAPIQYAGPGQINVLVPTGVNLNTTSQVRMVRGTTLSEPVAVDMAGSQTSLLQAEGNAYAEDHPATGGGTFLVTASSPASAGDTLVFYCAGLGLTIPLVADGAVSPASPRATVADVTAKIGEQNAPVVFAGLVSGFVGLYQLNLVVPAGVSAGTAVPLTVTSGGQTSPAVNLALR